VVHVDDLFVVGDAHLQKITKQRANELKIGSVKEEKFVHLGIEFEKHGNGDVTLKLEDYINKLTPIKTDESRGRKPKATDKASETEVRQLRALVGGLLWVAETVRPDVAIDSSQLSSAITTATVADLYRANTTLKYLTTTSTQGLTYRKLKRCTQNPGILRRSTPGWAERKIYRRTRNPDCKHKPTAFNQLQHSFVEIVQDKTSHPIHILWRITQLYTTPGPCDMDEGVVH